MHPCNVSTPMTCTAQNVVSEQKEALSRERVCPNILHFFFTRNCRPLLEKLTLDSLRDLQVEYFYGNTTQSIETLKSMVSVAPHNTLIALFLLLLNVDAKLKDKIWTYEIEQNHRKIERFLMDLKRPIVEHFCINESITIAMFVDNCWEAYVLA